MVRLTRIAAAALMMISSATSGSQAIAAPAFEQSETRLALAGVKHAANPEPGVVEIELDPAAYRSLWDSGMATVEGFPLPGGQRVDLSLRPFQVLAPDAVVINVNDDGDEVAARPAIRFVRGTVVGDIDSQVVLGLFQNRISGVVKTRDQEFGVGPREFSIDAPGAMDLRVWDRATEQGDWDCAVTHEDSNFAASIIDFDALADPSEASLDHLGGAQLRLDLAIDSTTEWCAHFGDDQTAAQNYLLSAIAQISAIYDAEVLEIFSVVFLRTFCGSVDPYTDGLGINDRNQLLSELNTEWTTNQTGVSRTVAHLFSKSDTSSSGGLANTVTCSGPTCSAVLCSESSGYGVTLFPATGGSPAGFEIAVAAHEFGHNHSSPHTNCLQDGGGNWLSTCNNTNSCGLNPWCQATGCYAGTLDQNITGTLMSTGCNSRDSEFDDNIVETILRSSAEAASCIGAAGAPGDVRESTGSGLRLSVPASCPGEDFQNDDGSADSATGGTGTAQLSWIKRFTPACYPFQLTDVDTLIWNNTVAVGRPIRIVVYADPSGSGDPANSSLVYTEDVTVQTISFSAFNEYTLASPVTLAAGDLYIGFYDLVDDADTNFIASLDFSTFGDSWRGFSTDPAGYSLRASDTFLIRGAGGPIAGGSLELSWGAPCNAGSVPGQDFGVYRGDIGSFTSYSSLTCTTGSATEYVVEGAADDSFFLVVPQTTPSEGSYGRTSDQLERPAAAIACKPQEIGSCP